jgi:hypothetical protein
MNERELVMDLLYEKEEKEEYLSDMDSGVEIPNRKNSASPMKGKMNLADTEEI